ncbi:hypothetical protein MCAG_05337 [Micromonospora sp. ATCC 39149]|nr:hypothetical protein MCAG_05337 [Micromonospora sp. ATCC 39149]
MPRRLGHDAGGDDRRIPFGRPAVPGRPLAAGHVVDRAGYRAEPDRAGRVARVALPQSAELTTEKGQWMSEVVEFALDGGGTVLVAVDETPGIAPASAADDVLRRAGVSFNKAIGQARDAASAALTEFRSMVDRPDEVEISFGIQLTAEAGALIARTGVQGQLQVTVRWQRLPTA